jgi:Ca2+-binding EF-hand superfamily protein
MLLRPQAALKSFDDDHNGALDEGEFERFAKSLMSTGAPAAHSHTQQLSWQQHRPPLSSA